MNKQRIINTSIDCITKFRASNYPLKNIAQDLIKLRKLNSSERKYFLDLVFSWARESNIVIKFLESSIKFFSGLSNQQKDNLALDILAHKNLLDREKYDLFVKNLNEKKYLLACGDLIAEELIQSFGEQASCVAKSLWQRPDNYLAFDYKKVSLEQVCEELARVNIIVSSHANASYALKIIGNFNWELIPENIKPHVWLMDAGSQIIAHCVQAKKHERVLDMCVGEGGKARLIALRECELVALDNNPERLIHAKKRLKDFNIKFICADATKNLMNEEKFDWILVDAPCSGSGVLRRHPDLVYRLSKADLKYYQKLQHELLLNAIKLLKPKGKLIYATCSLFKTENEQQINKIITTNTHIIPFELENLNKSSVTLLPHSNNCDGFFVAGLTNTHAN